MMSRRCWVKLVRLDNGQKYEAGLAIVKKEPKVCPEHLRNIKSTEVSRKQGRRTDANGDIERELWLKPRTDDDFHQFDSAAIKNENIGALFMKHEPVPDSICGQGRSLLGIEQQTFGGNYLEQPDSVHSLQKDPNYVKDHWWDTIPVTKQTSVILGKKKCKKSTKVNTKESVLIYRCKLCLKSYESESFLFEHSQTHTSWIKLQRCNESANITLCNKDSSVDKFNKSQQECPLSKFPQERVGTVKINHVAEHKAEESIRPCFVKLERCDDLVRRFDKGVNVSINDVSDHKNHIIHCEDRSDISQEGIEAIKLDNTSKQITGENSCCKAKVITVPHCENEGTSIDLKSKKCDICNQIFLNKGDLFRHQKTHNIQDNASQISKSESLANGGKHEFSRRICHKAFGSKSRNTHVVNHTKTFEHAHCLKRYLRKKNLKAHRKSKHFMSCDDNIKSVITVEGKTDNLQRSPVKEMPPLILFEHLGLLQINKAFEKKSSLSSKVISSHALDQNKDSDCGYLQIKDQKLVTGSINPALFQNHDCFQNVQASAKTPPEKLALDDQIDNVKSVSVKNKNSFQDKTDHTRKSPTKEMPPLTLLKNIKRSQSNKTFNAKFSLSSNTISRNSLCQFECRNKLVGNLLTVPNLQSQTSGQNNDSFHNIQQYEKTLPEKPALYDQIGNMKTVAVESANSVNCKTNYFQQSPNKEKPTLFLLEDLECSQSNNTLDLNKLVANSLTANPTSCQNNDSFHNILPCGKTLPENFVREHYCPKVSSDKTPAEKLLEKAHEKLHPPVNTSGGMMSTDILVQNPRSVNPTTTENHITKISSEEMLPEKLPAKANGKLHSPVKTFLHMSPTDTPIQNQSKQHKKKQFLCKICDCHFTSAYFLKIHKRQVHLAAIDKSETGSGIKGALSGTSKKPLCQSKIKMLKQYFCKICNKGYATNYGHEAHMQTEHGLPEMNGRHLRCLWCPMIFTKPAELHAHKKIHIVDRVGSANDKNEFVCKVCGKTLGNVHAFILHSRVHAKFKSFACDLCGRHFMRKRALDNHKKNMHNPKNCFKCPNCPKNFAKAERLGSHFNVKTFRCEICWKELVESEDLKAHQLCHIDENLFHCHQCKETFHTKKDCERHIFTVHDERRPFNCHICFRTFDIEQIFEQHFKLHESMSASNSVKISVSESPCEKEGITVYNVHWQNNRLYGVTGRMEVYEVAK